MDKQWLLGEDLFPSDNVMEPISFDSLILMAQNINPEYGKDLRHEFFLLINERKQEAIDMFNRNYDRIMAAAFPDEEIEPCPLPYDEVEQLAKEIYDVLLANEMWIDVSIYYNGKRMSSSCGNNFRYNGEPFIEEDINPKDYFEYCGNILSMSFEGPVYQAINYNGGDIVDQLDAVFKKHGLYYELGDAWNLSLYKN